MVVLTNPASCSLGPVKRQVHAKVAGPSIVTSTYVPVFCGSKIEACQLSGSFSIPSKTALLNRSRFSGKGMLLLKITDMLAPCLTRITASIDLTERSRRVTLESRVSSGDTNALLLPVAL